MLYTLRFQCGYHFHLWQLNNWSLHHHSPMEHTHSRYMCIQVMVRDPCQECTKWLLPQLLQEGGVLCFSALLQLFQQYGGTYSLGEQSHPIPPPSLCGGERSSFPGLVPPSDMVNSKSMVGMLPGNSDVVIEYQVDEFT